MSRRKLIILLSVAGLLFVAYGVWWITSVRMLDDHIDELRAAGRVVDPLRLQPEFVDDEHNAAAALLEAQGWLELNTDYDASSMLDQAMYEGTAGFDDKKWAQLHAYLEALGPYYQRLEEVRSRSGWYVDYEFERGFGDIALSYISALQEAARHVNARARFDPVASGRTERAAQATQWHFVVAERFRPVLFLDLAVRSGSYRYANEILRHAHAQPGFDAALFRQIVDPHAIAELSRLTPPADMLHAERCLMLRAAADGELGSYFATGSPWRGIVAAHPQMCRDAVSHSHLIGRAIDAVDATPEGAARLSRTLVGDGPDWLGGEWIVRSFFRLYAGDATRLRLLRVAMAMLQERQETGAWPDALLDGLPQDPYASAPFRYEVTKTHVRIYCAKDETFKELLEDDLAFEFKR